MIKEFKQIEMVYADERTYNFKNGIAAIKDQGITEFKFEWGSKCRLDDSVFVARLKKVLPGLMNLPENAFSYTEVKNGLLVTLIDIA